MGRARIELVTPGSAVSLITECTMGLGCLNVTALGLSSLLYDFSVNLQTCTLYFEAKILLYIFLKSNGILRKDVQCNF